MLRESKAIRLPSQRTLRDYAYYTKAKCGFSDEVDEQLMEAAKISNCEEKDKYVVLLMDEMHIREDIVYDKHSGEMLVFNTSLLITCANIHRQHNWLLQLGRFQ